MTGQAGPGPGKKVYKNSHRRCFGSRIVNKRSHTHRRGCFSVVILSKSRMTNLALYLMLPSGWCLRLDTHLELIASARAFVSVTSNVLFRIVASYSSWMAYCQLSFTGHSIASRCANGFRSDPMGSFVNIGAFRTSRYVSGSPSELVSAFSIIGAFHASRYFSGSPSEPVRSSRVASRASIPSSNC